MIAVVKVGSSNELVLVNGDKVYSALSLNRASVLNDTYSYLKALPEIAELRVIMTCPLLGANMQADGIPVSQMNCGGINKVAYISKVDVDKLKQLACNLGLGEFKLYNMFDFLTLIGKQRSVIVTGKYLDKHIYTVYVDKTGIRDFRESTKVDKNEVLSVQKFAETDYAVSEFNNLLDSYVLSSYKNIQSMNDDELSRLYMNLLTDYIKPVKVIDATEEVVQGEEIHEIEGAIAQPEKVKTPSPDKLKKTLNQYNPEYTEMVKTNYALDAIGTVLALIMGITLFANYQLTRETAHIEDKINQVKEVVTPKEDNLKYLQAFASSLKSNKSGDTEVVQKISDIKIDGILAEIALKQDTVGVVVYLNRGSSDAEAKAAIDNYEAKLKTIINVDEVKEDKDYDVVGATLIKYIIHGSLK